MRIEEDMKLDYKDVLIRPKRSTLGSRKEVDLERGFTFRNYKGHDIRHYRGTPIMASNMDGVGTFEMADVLATGGIFTCLVKTYSVNQLVDYFDQDDRSHDPARTEYVAMSIGITDADHAKFRDVYEQTGSRLKYVCIDVANGYSERFAQFVKEFRNHYPNIVIIAGNVVTGEMTEELILSGADIVKVGIGPGSVCTTRIKTGVGYPQLSAIIECADAAHGLGGHIIADGGCSSSGDIAKAFGAGADFVMLGSMLAGTDQSPGQVFQAADGKKYKVYRGMASVEAQRDWRVQARSLKGISTTIPYKGCVIEILHSLARNIKSGLSYSGARNITELQAKAQFVTQTSAGQMESSTHILSRVGK